MDNVTLWRMTLSIKIVKDEEGVITIPADGKYEVSCRTEATPEPQDKNVITIENKETPRKNNLSRRQRRKLQRLFAKKRKLW